jgi:uncharacterized protein YbaP (TraB family)
VRRLLLLLALAACSSHDDPAPATNDPWAERPATPPSPSDPPSLDDKRKIEAEQCPTVAAPYFYRVTKNGPPSYLLGTFHADVALSKFPKDIADDIRAARLVVLETPPEGDHGSAQVQAVQPTSIADALGPADWKHYQELAGPTISKAVEFRKSQVAFITLIALYVDTTVRLEHDIARVAKRAQVATDGLETDDFQQALIGKLLDVRMLKAMLETTPDRATLARKFADELEHYCKGDRADSGTNAADRADMKKAGYSDAEIDAFDDATVYARNRTWIPKLEDMFATGNVFVAVGADHLRGPKGVVELLQARGWTVERIARP